MWGREVADGALLRIEGLHAFYGESHILHGVDLTVAEGETVTLLGRNGAGRTTILKSILGIVGRREGSIRLRGKETIALPPHAVARIGVGYCPEERGIFASLSVEENLLLPPKVAEGGMTIEEIYAMFPNLKERRKSPGGRLSGGERQMLAIGRILRTGATLLLLDEMTEGLAPVIVRQLSSALAELRRKGYTLVLVEQNFPFVAPLADRHCVVEHGRLVDTIPKGQLDARMDEIHAYLGV